MKATEFAALARVEREHWFYRGKRDIVRRWVDMLGGVAKDDVLVDVGAGTGQLLAEYDGTCHAVGIEPHPHALHIAGSKPIDLVQGSITALPVASGRAAVVTAMDVLEHVDEDAEAFAELLRVARPDGFLFVWVPAFPFLWSDWDEALGHRRRYTKRSLLDVVQRFEVRVRHCVYVNAAAFLPVLCYRWLRTQLGERSGGRWEDTVPAPLVNSVLYTLLVAPACWRWLSPPFGLSILCILQKSVAGSARTA